MSILLNLTLLVAFLTACVFYWIRGQQVISLTSQLKSARKDTQTWYNRVIELEQKDD